MYQKYTLHDSHHRYLKINIFSGKLYRANEALMKFLAGFLKLINTQLC